MKEKNGFTLSEVLVVIALISIIAVITVPSVMSINKRINKRLLEGKKDLLLSSAQLYAKENKDLFVGDELFVNVGTLVEKGYYDKDIDKNNDTCNSSYGCVMDPTNNTSLNDKRILVLKKKNNYVAIWDGKEGSSDDKELVDLVKKELKCTNITPSNPCLYPGDAVNNYLKYNNIYWRLIGVYSIDNKEVVKMITDENIYVEDGNIS